MDTETDDFEKSFAGNQIETRPNAVQEAENFYADTRSEQLAGGVKGDVFSVLDDPDQVNADSDIIPFSSNEGNDEFAAAA